MSKCTSRQLKMTNPFAANAENSGKQKENKNRAEKLIVDFKKSQSAGCSSPPLEATNESNSLVQAFSKS